MLFRMFPHMNFIFLLFDIKKFSPFAFIVITFLVFISTNLFCLLCRYPFSVLVFSFFFLENPSIYLPIVLSIFICYYIFNFQKLYFFSKCSIFFVFEGKCFFCRLSDHLMTGSWWLLNSSPSTVLFSPHFFYLFGFLSGCKLSQMTMDCLPILKISLLKHQWSSPSCTGRVCQLVNLTMWWLGALLGYL